MTEKQVVKKEQATAVAEFDTSMFEADASAGIQNISNEDMALPFLKIVSGLDGFLMSVTMYAKVISLTLLQVKSIKAKTASRLYRALISVSLYGGNHEARVSRHQ